MNELDSLIAKAQRDISYFTLIIIAAVLGALFFNAYVASGKIDPIVEKLMLVLLGALVSNWASQNQFWFGRPRSAGIPDPGPHPPQVGPVARVDTMNVEAPKPESEKP